MGAAGGYVAAVFAAVANGSFGTISKLDKVQRAQIPFPIFSFWTCMGIILSSLFFLAKEPRIFDPWGLLSGVFFVISMANTFLAIQRLGLGSGTGIWCGTSILVSFTWAIRVQGEKISSAGLAAPGIMLLVAGVVVIAFNGQVADSRRKQEEYADLDEEIENGEGNEEPAFQRKRIDSRGYPLGVAAAVLAGIFGGLVLGPMYFAADEAKGLQYMPSMAVGVLIAAPIITLVLLYFSSHIDTWSFYPKTAALPGIASGIIWNAGNALSIVASTNPDVGLGVAYPIMQAGLFVAGLWGILLFGELRMAREQVVYWIGGLVLISGAVMLAFSK